MNDVEFVMVGGRVQAASETIVARLPFEAQHGLEPYRSMDRYVGCARRLRRFCKELKKCLARALCNWEKRKSASQRIL